MNLIGKEIRGIKIERKIGAGGMGSVYLGRVQKSRRGMKTGEKAAVKVLHPHLAENPASLSRFKREAGLGLTMRHPHIVQIFQVGSESVDGNLVHFLVQEFIEGTTLKDFIRESCLMSDPFLRKIAEQIVRALTYIHRKGIVHRDLKPENVFLDGEGVIKVVDFGFSHAEKALKNHDSSEGFFGTVAYAAPERFGPDPVKPASDLYSFGVLLYELALGENPFLAEDLTSTIARHLYTRPAEPRSKNPHISPFMSLFITALLEKDPVERLRPAFRLLRILKKGEASRWWRSVRSDADESGLSLRRQELQVMRRTEAFGRKRESASLLNLFDEVVAGGECRAVCVSGEAGLGKTRLIDQLLEEMDRVDRPGRMILVDGAQGSIKVPYYPLLSALGSTLGVGDLGREARRAVLQEKLDSLFPGESREKAEGLANFLISALPDSDEPAEHLTPEHTARWFADLFKALAEKDALLLVVENVLIADPSTFRTLLSLLGYLRSSPVMFLFTLRPGETFRDERERPNDLERLLEAMEMCGGRNWVDLKRLPRADISRMLCALGFPEKIANGPFGERVFTVTEGNPYLVLEIAKLIEVEGRLLQGDMNWHGLIQEIPSSVQDIFYRRLFRISPLEREILDFASVIGRRFKLDEIVKGLKLDFNEAARAISRLQNRFALIRPVGSFYRFDHVLIRELLYNRLDHAARARFHRKIGERCAAIARERPLTGRECYMASVHFSRAGDSWQSLAYFQEAFDYLRFKHAHDRAYTLAMRAAEHLERLRQKSESPDPSFCCDLYLKQADVSGFLGHRKVQFTALKAALQAGKKSDIPALKALVRLRFGQYYHATSRYLSAMNVLESALHLMKTIGDLRGEADVLETKSLVYLDIGDGERAMNTLRRALMIRDELGDRTGRAGVLVLMANYYLDHNKSVAAAEALTKANQICKELDDLQGQASVLMGRARMEMGQQNFGQAEKILQEAIRLTRRIGDAVREADLHATLGRCRYQRQGTASALEAYGKAYRIAQAMRDRARQVRLICTMVDLLIDPAFENPDPDRALDLARKAVRLSRSSALPIKDRVEAMNALASVFMVNDRMLSAFAIYRKVLRLLEEEDGPSDRVAQARTRYEKVARQLGKLR